jgi:hypothetical protein
MIASTEMMEMKKQITQLLQQTISGVDVTEGFSPQQYFLTLRRPMICVTIQSVSAQKSALENYIGVGFDDSTSRDLYGYFCDVVVGISLYLPKGYKEKDGNDLFLTICSQLLFDQNYEFEEIDCKEMDFDEKIQAFILPITAKTSLILTREEDFAVISDIQVKRKEGVV